MSRWREVLIVLVASAALTAALTYPWAFRIGRAARVDSLDGQFSIWNVAWVARTLVADPRHVLDANIFYPHRGTLAYSETNLGAGVLAIPAYWATGSPFIAHDSAVLLGFVLSATCTYYLVMWLTRSRWAAAVSAACFAFCPFVFARTTEVQLLMTFGIPLSMLAFHRMVDRPGVGRSVALGLAMTCQTYFCAYYGVFVVMMVGFSALTVTVTRRQWTDRRHWTSVVMAFGTALLLILPLFVRYLVLQHKWGFVRPLDEAVRYASDWRSYLASASYLHRWMLARIGTWRDVDFPGFVATVLGVTGAWAGWRAGGRSRELTILYGGIVMFFGWASFGPEAGLYTVMYRTMPVFTMMRAPSRFAVVVAFGLSVLAALAVRALITRAKQPVAVGIALGLVVSAELAVPLIFSRIPAFSPAYRLLARQPRGVTVELPFFPADRAIRHVRYMLNSTEHWMPLVNGFSDWLPPDFVANGQILAAFPSSAAFALLRENEVRYAVVHLDAYALPARIELNSKLAELAPYLRPLYADHDTRLFEIVAWPQ